jgi:adenylate kinase
VREHLGAMPRGQGVVFDGFPRTVPQAVALNAALGGEGRAVDQVVLLEADDEVLVKRISGRRSSPSGRVYNVHFDPPRREGLCDDTGEALIHRADDQPDTVRTRLAVYRKATAPLIGYYDARGVLARVDGAGDIGQVRTALWEAVGAVRGSTVAGA